MALNIKKFIFCPTDFSLIYTKGSTADDRAKNDPVFVKIFGFAIDSENKPICCYLLEEFATFNLSKNDLLKNLNDHCVIRSSGMISNDQHYFHKINLQEYKFFDSFDFGDVISVPDEEFLKS